MSNFGNANLGFFVGGTSGGGGGGVSGSGTTNTLPKWASSTSLSDSQITDNGSVITFTNLQFENNASGYSGYSRLFNNSSFAIGGLTNYNSASNSNRPYITLGIVGGNNMTTGTTFIQNSIGDVSQTTGTYTNTKITGTILTFSGTTEFRFLNVNPTYNDGGNPNTFLGTIRGLYYNLSQDSPLPINAKNIAWENVNGDIIFGNLATGGSDELVLIDSIGKLKKQVIPVASSSTQGYLSSSDWNTFNNKTSNNQIVSGYQGLGSSVKAVPIGLNLLLNVATATSLVIGRQILTPVYLSSPATITGVRWFQATLGNYTANNYNGVGLYSVSGGSLTLIASSTNDGTIWQTFATGTWGNKAFSSPLSNLSAGTYYVSALYNYSVQVTAPQLQTITSSSTIVQVFDFTASRLNCTLASQNTLPNPLTLSSTINAIASHWLSLF